MKELVEIGKGIWVIDGEMKKGIGCLMSCFPVRMTILKMRDDGSLLYSPFDLEKVSSVQLDKSGKVKVIIAPNSYHHVYIEAYAAAYPDATLFGPTRVQKLHPTLKFQFRKKPSPPTRDQQMKTNTVR